MHNDTNTTKSTQKAHICKGQVSSDLSLLMRRLRALSFVVAAEEFSEWAADIRTGVLEILNALAMQVAELVKQLTDPEPQTPFPDIGAV